MSSSRMKKVLKWIGRIFGALLALVLLVFILINLPFVQNKIVDFAENFVRKKTGAEITVERIAITLGGRLVIRGVHVPDQQGNPILDLGSLKVGIAPGALFQKKVKIKTVSLADVAVDLHPVHDTVMNYQYLIDAFAGDPAEEPPPPEPEPEEGGSSWGVELTGTDVDLENIAFRMIMPDSSMNMDYQVGSLIVHTDHVDPMAGIFEIDKIELDRTAIELIMKGGDTEEEETESSPLDYLIRVGDLALNEVQFKMGMDDLDIDAFLGSVAVNNCHGLFRGDTMQIDITQFDLGGSRYTMDFPSDPPSPGFDYSHMALDSVQINIADFNYLNLDITGEVQQLAAKDHSGFRLSDFATQVHYSPDSIELWDLQAVTPDSRIMAEHSKVTFPFLEDSTLMEQTVLDLDMDNTTISFHDLAYFLPQFNDNELLQVHRNDSWEINAHVHGRLADLTMDTVELKGPGDYARLSGRIQHATDMDRMVLDLRLHDLEASGNGIRSWMPEGSLPEYIELPNRTALAGTVRGPVSDLELHLGLKTARKKNPVAASLQIDGRVKNVMDTDRLAYDVIIDSLVARNEELCAYLPDEFPEYIELPETVILGGHVWGTMDSLHEDLVLKLARGGQQSKIHLAGWVDQFTNTDSMSFDQSLEEFVLLPEETMSYLPDSTLPEYVLIPAIMSGTGKIQGNMSDFVSQLSFDLSEGSLDADLVYRDSAYKAVVDLEDFEVQSIFTDSLTYDSVVG